jgi:hypothetical protein
VRGHRSTSALTPSSLNYLDLDTIHCNSRRIVKMSKCETCPKTFGTQEACKQHMTEKSHRKPTKKCDQCNKLFKDREAAEAHMTQVKHWNPKFSCETCPIKFHTQEAAKQHMTAKSHYRNHPKPGDQRSSSEHDLKMVGDYSKAFLELDFILRTLDVASQFKFPPSSRPWTCQQERCTSYQ